MGELDQEQRRRLPASVRDRLAKLERVAEAAKRLRQSCGSEIGPATRALDDLLDDLDTPGGGK